MSCVNTATRSRTRRGAETTSLDLAGRTAIVTGASRGIGLAVAQRFAEVGANVVVTFRKQDSADAAAARLGNALGFAAHAADVDAARRCVDVTLKCFGSVDILINNAGVTVGLRHRLPSPCSAGRTVDLPMSYEGNSTVSIELAHEFSFWLALNPAVDFGAGPMGRRTYFEVTSGAAAGERFNATAFGGGGDWVLLGPDNFARLDVRLQFKTADGALVYIRYFGLLELNAKVAEVMASGGSTTYADHYCRTTPRLETGDERYAWMNHSVFVARGRLLEEQKVEYEVYRVV